MKQNTIFQSPLRGKLTYQDEDGLPTFTITPHGVLAHIRVLEFTFGLVAFLSCTESFPKSEKETSSLSLCLYPFHGGETSLNLPIFRARSNGPRLMTIPPSKMPAALVQARWKDIYITHVPPFRRAEIWPLPLPLMRLNSVHAPPFWVPKETVAAKKYIQFLDVTEIPLGWTGTPPAALLFDTVYFQKTLPDGKPDKDSEVRTFYVRVTLGRCDRGGPESSRRHWAVVEIKKSTVRGMEDLLEDEPEDTHVCKDDHIKRWERGRDGRRAKRISVKFPGPPEIPLDVIVGFSKWPLNPQKRTLTLHVDVEATSEDKGIEAALLAIRIHRLTKTSYATTRAEALRRAKWPLIRRP